MGVWVCVNDVLQYVGIKKSVFQLLVHLSKKEIFLFSDKIHAMQEVNMKPKFYIVQNFTRLPHLFNLV